MSKWLAFARTRAHVVIAQLLGRTVDTPSGLTYYANDLQQTYRRMRFIEGAPPVETPKQGDGERNALTDARWNKQLERYRVTYDL